MSTRAATAFRRFTLKRRRKERKESILFLSGSHLATPSSASPTGIAMHATDVYSTDRHTHGDQRDWYKPRHRVSTRDKVFRCVERNKNTCTTLGCFSIYDVTETPMCLSSDACFRVYALSKHMTSRHDSTVHRRKRPWIKEKEKVPYTA